MALVLKFDTRADKCAHGADFDICPDGKCCLLGAILTDQPHMRLIRMVKRWQRILPGLCDVSVVVRICYRVVVYAKCKFFYWDWLGAPICISSMI